MLDGIQDFFRRQLRFRLFPRMLTDILHHKQGLLPENIAALKRCQRIFIGMEQILTFSDTAADSDIGLHSQDFLQPSVDLLRNGPAFPAELHRLIALQQEDRAVLLPLEHLSRAVFFHNFL